MKSFSRSYKVKQLEDGRGLLEDFEGGTFTGDKVLRDNTEL